MVAGFSIPLYIILAFIGTVALNLMLPAPLYRPAVALCVFTRRNGLARTVINTSTGFLLLMLIAPAYEYYTVSKFQKAKMGDPGASHIATDPTDNSEVSSQLNASLIVSVIAMLFLTRHLGVAMHERDEAQEVASKLGGHVERVEPEQPGAVANKAD